MSEPLVDVSGHRRRRRRAARLKLARRIGIAVGVLAVLAGLGWLVWESPVLAVTRVEVQGNTLVSAEAVVEAAAVPVGTPLARVDTAGVAERVGALRPVAQVAVVRSWPDTLTLEVTERQVRLAVATGGGHDWVDADGIVFHHTTERPEGVLLAAQTPEDPEILAGMVTVAAALPEAVRERAGTISAETADSIVVRLTDGSRVVWGSAEASDLKARVLSALLDVDAAVYDVSSPSHPTTRAR